MGPGGGTPAQVCGVMELQSGYRQPGFLWYKGMRQMSVSNKIKQVPATPRLSSKPERKQTLHLPYFPRVELLGAFGSACGH